MAPTIRIVSLRVGRRKGHPIPDRPTRRDPIPLFHPNAPDTAGGPSPFFHTIPDKNPARTASRSGTGSAGTNDAEGMGRCGKRRKDTGTLPFPHDVHRGGSAPWRAKNKRSAGSSPAPHRCIPARPPSPDRKEIDTPSVRIRRVADADGRRQKKRTTVVPAALRALSVSAGRSCESAFTISTDACVRSRRE